VTKKFKVMRVANITSKDEENSVFFEIFEISTVDGVEHLNRIPELYFANKEEAELWVRNKYIKDHH
jgi:hypothetical protein